MFSRCQQQTCLLGVNSLSCKLLTPATALIKKKYRKSFFINFAQVNTVFTRVSTRGAHLILGSQRGPLIRGRRSLNTSKRDQNTFNLSL